HSGGCRCVGLVLFHGCMFVYVHTLLMFFFFKQKTAYEIVVMAGPCSGESREQVFEVAAKVKAAGARILRGGAFKPRTSPYSFQGLEEEGLKYLAEAKRETGLPVVTEVMEPEKVDLVAHYADILQIGARSIQN